MIGNLFYFANINKIGGVESFYWYLAQKYQDYDIAIVYRTADEAQLARLRPLVRLIKYKEGMRLKCKRAFFNYNTDIIKAVEAEEFIQVVHGDYKALRVKPIVPPEINRIIGVSAHVAKTYSELTGREVEVCYNPISVPKPRRVLHLISATRLTAEKGKERIKRLAEILDREGIPYTWSIFTDDKGAIKNDNIVYRSPKLNIADYIAEADYLIQLSSNEGYCFSVVESLLLGVPVIVTDLPVFRELGIKDGIHGFVLDMELSKVPTDKIYQGLGKVAYKAPQDLWSHYLVEGESTYKKELKTMVPIRCTKPFYDLERQTEAKVGDTWETNKVRADYIIEAGHAEYTVRR